MVLTRKTTSVTPHAQHHFFIANLKTNINHELRINIKNLLILFTSSVLQWLVFFFTNKGVASSGDRVQENSYVIDIGGGTTLAPPEVRRDVCYCVGDGLYAFPVIQILHNHVRHGLVC